MAGQVKRIFITLADFFCQISVQKESNLPFVFCLELSITMIKAVAHPVVFSAGDCCKTKMVRQASTIGPADLASDPAEHTMLAVLSPDHGGHRDILATASVLSYLDGDSHETQTVFHVA
jgi:hypothetical protein